MTPSMTATGHGRAQRVADCPAPPGGRRVGGAELLHPAQVAGCRPERVVELVGLDEAQQVVGLLEAYVADMSVVAHAAFVMA